MAETIGALLLAPLIGQAAALFTIGATTITLATVVGTAALAAGAIGLQMLLARPGAVPGTDAGAPALPSPDSGHQALRQTVPPRLAGYGELVRLAGSYVLYEEKDGNSFDIMALLHGEITAFRGYYLHDDVVELDGSGVVQEQGDGRYAGNVIAIKTRFGVASETAYSEVTTALSAIWTSAHKGNGIASALLICGATGDPTTWHNTFPRGKPELSVVADLIAILDPRDGVTRVTNNPVLQLIDFLTSSDRGMGLDYAALITPVLDALMAEADLCDVLVATASGATEKRYEGRGTFTLDSDPADVVATILESCDGWIGETGDGALALWVGVYRAPTVTFTADHIKGFRLEKGVPDEQLVNELTIDFTSPLADYKTVPGQPWRDEASISEVGKIRSQRFALPWVYSHSQARRLAKRKMARLNAPIRGTISTTLYGLAALGQRWIAIEAGEIHSDLAGLVIEVLPGAKIDLVNARLTFPFVKVNPNEIDAWDPETEEGTAPIIPDKLVVPPPPVPQSINAFPNEDGFEPGEGEHVFVITFDDTGRGDLRFQCAWRVNGSSDPFTNDPIENPFVAVDYDGRAGVKGGYGITVPGTYEVKVRSFLSSGGVGSAFSSTDTVVITLD